MTEMYPKQELINLCKKLFPESQPPPILNRHSEFNLSLSKDCPSFIHPFIHSWIQCRAPSSGRMMFWLLSCHFFFLFFSGLLFFWPCLPQVFLKGKHNFNTMAIVIALDIWSSQQCSMKCLYVQWEDMEFGKLTWLFSPMSPWKESGSHLQLII